MSKDDTVRGWQLDFILCLPFYGCQYLSETPGIKDYVLIIRVVFFFIIAILFFRYKWGFPIITPLFLIASIVTLNTYFYGNDISISIARYYPLFAILMLTACRRNHFYRFLISLFFSSSLIAFVNLVTMILYPDGLSGEDRWLIGQKQDFVMVYFILMVSSLIIWSKGWYHKPIAAISLVCIVSLSKILTLGLTSILFLVVLLVLYSKKTIKYISAKLLFLLYLLMEFVMVSIVFYLKNYSSIINILDSVSASDQLSKKDTFLERVSMWTAALDSIVRNPFGIGVLTKENFGYQFVFPVVHVHNLIIDLSLTGGIVSSLLFLYLNYYVYRLLNNIRTMERNILVYSLFGANLLMLTEALYFPFVFCIYMLSFVYIHNFRNNLKAVKS